MKKLTFSAVAAGAAFLFTLVSSAIGADTPAKPAAAAQPPKASAGAGASAPAGTVALVNGAPIPKAEYERAIKSFSDHIARIAANAPKGAPPPGPEKVKDEVLKQLIARELLYQESAKYPPKDLPKQVEEEFKRLQASAPSAQAFQEQMKANGVTEKELKDTIAKQLTIRNYVETQIKPTVKVSDAEVQKFYNDNKDRFKVPEQMKASHILIPVDPKAAAAEKDKAKAKAQDLQKRAAKGEDFAKLARENSGDPGSAKNGGDLGFFAREQMVPAFATAAFGLKEGQVSNVVETQFGYHVIKAGPHKAAGSQSFAEVKPKLTDYLKAKALDEALTKKIDALRNKATITVIGAQK